MNVNELAGELLKYPELKQRVEELLRITSNSGEGIALANDAEEQVILAVSGLGKEVLQNWATQRCLQASYQVSDSRQRVY